MNTFQRDAIYARGRLSNGRPDRLTLDGMTPRQRRRLVKKAGRDPYAIVIRDEGMGYPPSMQGFREVISARSEAGTRCEAAEHGQ